MEVIKDECMQKIRKYWRKCTRNILKFTPPPSSPGVQSMAYDSGHRGNVFQARAIPGSSLTTIVSCAADGQVSKVIALRWRSYKTLGSDQKG